MNLSSFSKRTLDQLTLYSSLFRIMSRNAITTVLMAPKCSFNNFVLRQIMFEWFRENSPERTLTLQTDLWVLEDAYIQFLNK